MAGKDQDNRIFVGGISWEVTERQLEDAFGRFGKILDCQVMLERDTGRPRGFGFLTFADHRAVDDAIREMDGREFGDRVISVNKAQPKSGEDPGHDYGGGYSSGGRGNYGGGYRSGGQDDCFRCGRPGHWARDCPSAVGVRGPHPLSPPRGRFGGIAGRGDKDRFESRDDRYGSRGRYVSDRYPPPASDRFAADRYGAPDRYPQNGYGKERVYDRDAGPRGSNDRYGAGGPARYDGRSYRDRPAPYDRNRRLGRPASFDRY